MEKTKKLFRSEKDRLIGGVCAGLAIYLNTDVSIVRILFVLGLVVGFSSTFWIYIIMWLLVPTESKVDSNIDVVKENAEEMKETAKKTVDKVKSKL